MFWLTNYVDQPPQTNPVASDAICRPGDEIQKFRTKNQKAPSISLLSIVYVVSADGSVARSLASRSPSASNPDAAVAILSVGNFICGIGTAAFYPVGNTYLHDLFPEENLKVGSEMMVWIPPSRRAHPHPFSDLDCSVADDLFCWRCAGLYPGGTRLEARHGQLCWFCLHWRRSGQMGERSLVWVFPAGGASFLGAWWLPFAVSAFVCIGLGIVMAVGEKCLKMPFQLTEEEEEEARETGEVGRGRPAGFRKTASGVWNKLWREWQSQTIRKHEETTFQRFKREAEASNSALLWPGSTAGVFVSSYQLLKRPTFSLVVLGMATDVSINSALSPFLVSRPNKMYHHHAPLWECGGKCHSLSFVIPLLAQVHREPVQPVSVGFR